MENRVAKLSNRNYFVVLGLVSLVVLGVTALTATKLTKSILFNTRVIVLKNAANDQLQKDLDAASTLTNNYEKLGHIQQLINTSLPPKYDYPNLIAMFEQIENSTGATFTSIAATPGGGTTTAVAAAAPTTIPPGSSSSSSKSTTTAPVAPVAASPQTVKVNLPFTTSYERLKVILAAFEHSATPMRVNNIQMTGSGSSMTVTVELSTYFQDAATLPLSMQEVKK